MMDAIGGRGEALFYTAMTRFYGRRLPFFRPHFLGVKFMTLDFFVELVDAGAVTPFFFVQVKTTTQGYTKKDRRLKVQVSAEEVHRLIAYPAPTYVVGIDERQEVGYLQAVLETQPQRIASLSTVFPLHRFTLEALWQEVRDYWYQRDMRFTRSYFVD